MTTAQLTGMGMVSTRDHCKPVADAEISDSIEKRREVLQAKTRAFNETRSYLWHQLLHYKAMDNIKQMEHTFEEFVRMNKLVEEAQEEMSRLSKADDVLEGRCKEEKDD